MDEQYEQWWTSSQSHTHTALCQYELVASCRENKLHNGENLAVTMVFMK